jgi:hypothetical protein
MSRAGSMFKQAVHTGTTVTYKMPYSRYERSYGQTMAHHVTHDVTVILKGNNSRNGLSAETKLPLMSQ